MKNNKGFTLIELMISLAIVGILLGSALPLFQTYQQRARGQEATIMAKQILDGQILYYLEHDSFFPPFGTDTWWIPDPNNPGNTATYIQAVEDALKIQIPTGRPLTYQFDNYGTSFLLTVYAEFPIFKNGIKQLIGYLDDKGEVIWITDGGSIPS